MKKRIFAKVGGALLVATIIGASIMLTDYNFPSARYIRGEFAFENEPPPRRNLLRRNIRANAQHMRSFVTNPNAAGDIVQGGAWSFRANSANGIAERRLRLSADELTALRVDSTNANGEVTLTVSQRGKTRTTCITTEFDGYVDMSGFDAGRVRFTLTFADARDVDTVIRWR